MFLFEWILLDFCVNLMMCIFFSNTATYVVSAVEDSFLPMVDFTLQGYEWGHILNTYVQLMVAKHIYIVRPQIFL